jgi:hypothetical protein
VAAIRPSGWMRRARPRNRCQATFVFADPSKHSLDAASPGRVAEGSLKGHPGAQPCWSRSSPGCWPGCSPTTLRGSPSRRCSLASGPATCCSPTCAFCLTRSTRCTSRWPPAAGSAGFGSACRGHYCCSDRCDHQPAARARPRPGSSSWLTPPRLTVACLAGGGLDRGRRGAGHAAGDARARGARPARG